MPKSLVSRWFRAAAHSARERFAALCAISLRSSRQDYPHLKENILSAMGNVETSRLLDPRFLELEEPAPEELFPIVE